MLNIDWIKKKTDVKKILQEIQNMNKKLHSLHQSILVLESKALIIREAAKTVQRPPEPDGPPNVTEGEGEVSPKKNKRRRKRRNKKNK